MGMEIWYREDVQQVLKAADLGCRTALAEIGALGLNVEQLAAYRRGYEAALTVVAAGFGIPVVQPQRPKIERVREW